MTTLNFALSRAAARDWREGDEIVCTQLDHDGNISPWLELAHDRDFKVQLARVDDECRLDLDHLRSLVNERTRVVAYPWAANAVGTVTPVAEIAQIAHDAGALAWVDAVHYGPHGQIDVEAAGADVLLCSPYKFYGPHLGLAFGRRSCWSPGGRTRCARPTCSRSGTATRRGRSPTSCSPALWRPWTTSTTSAGTSSPNTRTSSDSSSSTGFRTSWTLHGIPSMDGRVPTFALTHASLSPQEAATRLGERGFAVWHGNYYAVEIMKRLGLPDGAVRIGIVHYNTAHEVDVSS